MSLEFDFPKEKSSIIKVIGVGGAGTNAVNHMATKGIKGVNFIVCNTDNQHLDMSPVKNKLLLGPKLLNGSGTGADPEMGKKATLESLELIREELQFNTKMLFIAAGLGKGTGTGGSPVIAKLAREMGILTVAIVTTPFSFPKGQQITKAEYGLKELKDSVDAIIAISNDKLLETYGDLKQSEAYALGDDVLKNAAKGIAEIITGAGTHNTDFNDVRNVLINGGTTIMGIGVSTGENRAINAVRNALNNPLIVDFNIKGAKRALVNITYSQQSEPTLNEIGQIIREVSNAAESDLEILHGTSEDETLEDELSVTIVITGFEESHLENKQEVEPNKIFVDTPPPAQKVEPKQEIELTTIEQLEIDTTSKYAEFQDQFKDEQIIHDELVNLDSEFTVDLNDNPTIQGHNIFDDEEDNISIEIQDIDNHFQIDNLEKTQKIKNLQAYSQNVNTPIEEYQYNRDNTYLSSFSISGDKNTLKIEDPNQTKAD